MFDVGNFGSRNPDSAYSLQTLGFHSFASEGAFALAYCKAFLGGFLFLSTPFY